MQRAYISAEKRRTLLLTTAIHMIVGNAVFAFGGGECSHIVLFKKFYIHIYQNGMLSSFASGVTAVAVVAAVAAAGSAIRLPCLRVLLLSHRSFSSSVSVTMLPSSSR